MPFIIDDGVGRIDGQPKRYRRPAPSYLSFVLSALVWGSEKTLDSFFERQVWWKNLPLEPVAALLAAVGVGALLADIWQPNSWLRYNWREFWRVFDVVYVRVGKSDQPFEHIALTCGIKFRKHVKNAQLTVRVISYAVNGPQSTVVHCEQLKDVPKDSDRILRLASVPISSPGWTPKYSLWGEKLSNGNYEPGQPTVCDGQQAMLEVCVGRQTYRIYAHALSQQQEAERRLYVLSEDRIPILP